MVLEPKMHPKWVIFYTKKDEKTRPQIYANFDAKVCQKGSQNEEVGGRGVARCGGGRGGGNPPPDLSEVGFEK